MKIKNNHENVWTILHSFRDCLNFWSLSSNIFFSNEFFHFKLQKISISRCLLLNYLIETNCFKINYFFLNLQNDWGKTVIDYNYHELVLRWVNVLWHFLLVCHLVKTNQNKKTIWLLVFKPMPTQIACLKKKKIVHRKHFFIDL